MELQEALVSYALVFGGGLLLVDGLRALAEAFTFPTVWGRIVYAVGTILVIPAALLLLAAWFLPVAAG